MVCKTGRWDRGYFYRLRYVVLGRYGKNSQRASTSIERNGICECCYCLRCSRLIRKHLLPNCVGTLCNCHVTNSLLFLLKHSEFLRFSVSAPMASLGSSIRALDGQSYPYRLLFPAIAISIIILAFNLFGDGLRDALDPKLKK